MNKPISTHDDPTETGIYRLQAAYDVGTKRITQHFENLIRPATEAVRDYLAAGVK